MNSAAKYIDFDGYLSRYGEPGIQAIIESYEKREGIVCECGVSLQARWEALVTGEKPAVWCRAA